MKFIFFGLILTISVVLSACGNEVVEEEEVKKPSEEKTEEVVKEEVVEKPKVVEIIEEEKEIDTSVYVYAKQVDVTDAIDINQHVTVFVEMSEETKPGLATQHVVNQSYDFLQQEDIKGAKTVSIAVKQGDIKIAQFTVDKDKFTLDDSKPMSEAVINAAEIEFMTDEVKQFGQTMETW